MRKVAGLKVFGALTGLALLTAACTTTDPNTGEVVRDNTKTNALIGAAVGAGLGYATNTNKGEQGRKNAVIGAGIGALAGAAVGNYMDKQQAELRKELAGTGIGVTRNGDNIILNMPSDVTFATGSATIDSGFYPTLNDVATVLNKYPSTYVDIVGHADSTGSDAINEPLSENRANSTAAYLTGRGVANQRLFVAGMGSRQPIASNATPEGRAKNRRVEITLRPVTE
ncbi:OmpA family protein [Asticcacaulis sp. BYS171W]|uniref:OmpA family protein n=1 Tax=Asticcacaulis aquaticus TaxID=2984212 RepID=A0ABT5HRU3_9CAUL|nr:OmpA family protein [Asticcacaulis aquaticus]MDC7682704.1 OmpA family protein [Asticcacaulis aquaticus]